jgi:serine O-acetyltransferase
MVSDADSRKVEWRAYQRHRKSRSLLAWAACRIAVFRHRFWSAITGAEIPLNCKMINGGRMVPHPHGIGIHPDPSIGRNYLIFQQVTVDIGNGSVPVIKGRVDSGEAATAKGAPARIMTRSQAGDAA